jgi:histidine ammonia-lyase
VELVVAAQAVDLARPGRLGRGPRSAYDGVRSLVRPLDEDRPLGPELEALADALAAGDLLGDARDAVGDQGDTATGDEVG